MSELLRCALCLDPQPFLVPDDEVGRALMRQHLVSDHQIAALR